MKIMMIGGSRGFRRTEIDCRLIAQMIKFHKPEQLVHGACPNSPDMWAIDIALDFGLRLVEFPADWSKYGKSAGMKRNEEMARYVDFGILFWDNASRGTSNMIIQLRARRKEHVVVVRDAGKEV